MKVLQMLSEGVDEHYPREKIRFMRLYSYVIINLIDLYCSWFWTFIKLL